MFSSMRILKQQLKDQKVLFLGAGSAATGIAHLIADAMVEEGLTREEALARIKLFDSKGLVTKKRSAPLTSAKMPFAAEDAPAETFLEAIREIQPTAIIGVSAQGGAFTKECLEEMAKINERPIIFALSNPTSKAECTAEEAYTYTDARCLFASVPRSNLLNTKENFCSSSGQQPLRLPRYRPRCYFLSCQIDPERSFLGWCQGSCRHGQTGRSGTRQLIPCTLRSSRNFCGNRCGSCRLHLRQQSGRN